MRKKYKLPFVALCVALVYILGALLFGAMTTLPHVALAVADQKDLSAELTSAYADGTFSEDMVSKHKKVIIYSNDGDMLESYDPYGYIPYFCESHTEKYIASGADSIIARSLVVVEATKGDFDARYDIVAYTAEPIFVNGERIGTFVLLTDLISDIFFIENSFLGFNCVFFSFLICGIVLYFKQKSMARLRQNYIDNITHDLKTPIASIKALTTALNDHDMSADERSEYYGLILAEAGRQEHMVQNILELSRIQAKGISFKKITVSAETVLQPICERYSSLCDDLDMQWNEPEDLASLPTLHTNTDCIQRILDLLLANALRYTKSLVTMRIADNARHITVCISDNGSGIPANEVKHVFERFYRGSNSYVKGGNGLGLAIAKELADGIGERIWVESRVGEGSSFYLTISKAK